VALAITVLLVPHIRGGRGITIYGFLAQSLKPLQIYLGIKSLVIYQMLTAAQFVAIIAEAFDVNLFRRSSECLGSNIAAPPN